MNSRKLKDTHNDAIRELTALCDMLDCDMDLIESMSNEEADAELCAMGLDPGKSLLPTKSPRKPETKPRPIRILFLSANPWTAARRLISDEAEALMQTLRERASDARHDGKLIWFPRVEHSKHIPNIDVWGKPYFPEKTVGELLSEVISQKIVEVQRGVTFHREVLLGAEHSLKCLHQEMLDFSAGSKDNRRLRSIERTSRRYAIPGIIAAVNAVVIGILAVPSPRYLFAPMAVGLTLLAVELLGNIFRPNNSGKVAGALATLNKWLFLTTALAAVAGSVIFVLRASGGIAPGLLTAIDLLLILIASQCKAGYSIATWPRKLQRKINELQAEVEQTRHLIATGEHELKSLFDSRARLLSEEPAHVNPTAFTIMN